MTTLQEAAKLAIEALTYCEALNSSMIEQKRVALNALRAALAQQGEQAKPVAYITQTEQGPMVWTTEMYGEACTYCDDGEFPIPLYTAAPAPQAQDKSDNYLSGYCTGRTDLLKEQSAQLVTQPLAKTCDTCAHYQQGKHPGVSIHDETCYECRSYWGNKWEAA